MAVPANLEDILQPLKEAVEVLKSAALAAECNPATKPIGIRLFKMSVEAEGYGQYIGAYFQPARRAKLISPARKRWEGGPR
jgi:hypothetical protein